MQAKPSELPFLAEAVREAVVAEVRKIAAEVALYPPDTLPARYRRISCLTPLHSSLQSLYSPDFPLLSRSSPAVASCPRLPCSEDCLLSGTATVGGSKAGRGTVPGRLAGPP